MKNKNSVSSKYPMDGILRTLWRRCHPMDGKMKTTSSAFTDQPRLCHRKYCSLQHHHPCFRAPINLQRCIRRPRCSSARVTGTSVAPTADSKRNALLSALFALLTLLRTSSLALPQDPSFPFMFDFDLRETFFHTRAFFSSEDYSTVLLELTTQKQDVWR